MPNIIEYCALGKTKKPFPLLSGFSVSSLLVILLLVAILNMTLGRQLEQELLERDKRITAATVQAEVMEYLKQEPFEESYNNALILRDILHSVIILPGTFAVEFILTNGEIHWSMLDGGNTYRWVDNPEFQKALSGETMITRERFESRVYFEIQDLFVTVIYVPLIRDNLVIGLLKLFRNNELLKEQVSSLRRKVMIICALFGVLLYFTLLLIVASASRILKRQHQELRDSTDQLKVINQELQDVQYQLIARERLTAIGEVSAAVAHGLKNPLSSLRAALQLLKVREMNESERAELTEELLEETDRLTSKLNSLLSYVRPFEPKKEPVSLNQLLSEIHKGLERELKSRNISCVIDADSNLPTIELDQVLVEESLQIVLNNAMQVSPPGSRLDCRTFRETMADGSTFQVISVSDQGPGIFKKERERIFELFYTTHDKGTGLGLPICKKIIEAHQGAIEIKNRGAKGAVFLLKFPES